MRSVVLVLLMLLIAVAAFAQSAPSKWANKNDSVRSPTVTGAQIAPATGWRHFSAATSAGLDTLLNPGFVFNWYEVYVTGTVCSVATSSDPALVSAGYDKAAAADTMTAGYTATAYIGQAWRDTTYMPCPAGSRTFWGRGSQIKLKGGSGTAFITAFGN